MSGAACLTSIFTNTFVSSLCTPNSRTFTIPIALLRTLATTQCFKAQDRNVGKRTFTCQAALRDDVGTTISSSSFDGYQYSRLLPCPLENGPPRVEHLVVSEGGPVLEFISRALNLSPIFVADLIQFGAVYYALVCPEPPPTATPEQIKLFKEATSPSVLKKRLSVKGKTVREAQKTFLINHIHEFVEAGTYIRVRVHPKRFPPGPPRVEHLVVSEGGPVLEFISRSLNLPPIFVADLIQFGAVYYALVCPEPPPTATPEHIKLFKEVTSPSILKKRLSVKGKTVREAQKTFRITHIHEFVEAGTYIRVHVHPKRFPRCYEIDWKSRIIAVEESFVVLDKPAGTSVGGTTDNIEETCATFATRALGLAAPLKTTHQIDNCTEGCVVLARTKEYCSVFHGKIREKIVKKLYRALAAAPVPRGIMSHYMRPVNVAPRLVSEGNICY
ncbi:Rna pseudouridine synthase 6 protein [Thalictrum thalictroides]|uniref:Rna pseudouridine synthase 6 protein n=1 Tax=Thalictrum thalictroides TaxID=46969 RepID=A0A7J6VTI4_THATH|nr:Rna pseudouridine synthase 6 protein [Thalictrum thalictroides]